METHGPIEQEYRDKMNVLATVLDEMFNGEAKGKERKIGFALLLFEFDNLGRMNYISNAERTDILCAMKEFIAHAEGRFINKPIATT